MVGVRRDNDRDHRVLDAVLAIGAGLELSDVLHRIVRAAVDLVDARRGALGVLAPDGSRFTELVHVGMDEETVRLLRNGVDAAGLLDVPITVQDTVFGHLYLGGTGFTGEDGEVARALATAAGIAVHNARLFEESRRREAWLRASNEISATLLAGRHQAGELRLVTERAREVAGAPVAALALPDERQPGKLVFQVVDGLGDIGRLEGVAVDIDGTASGMVFSTGEPLLLDSYGDAAATWQGDAGAAFHPALKELGSAAIVPLAAGRQPLGVLLLCRRRDEVPFGQSDLELLENFALHATFALQYSRARADQQRLVVFEDRDRIARDLHDLVIQRIFATGMALEAAANVLNLNPANAAERIRRAVDDLDGTIREIRTTVFALQQPSESASSVRAQVLEAVEAAAGALGFAPSVRFDGPVDTIIGEEIREHLLAVLREALSNTARHARATEVSVAISARDGLRLVVADNGVGLPAGGRRSGLANLSARAAQLGGTFVTEAADPGTVLVWRVPLRRR